MRRQRKLFSTLIIVVSSLILLLPLFVTLLNSLFRDLSNIIPEGFTLAFYAGIFAGSGGMASAVGKSLLIAILPTLVLLVLLLLAMYVVQIHYPKVDRYLDLLSKIPYGIQGVILAVSIISLYASSGTFLSNRIFLLSCAYGIVILPYMYQGIKNALTTLEVQPILEAAETLGASKLYAFFRIIVPSILKGVTATILLSVGILFSDFVLVNIIAGSYYETTSIFLDKTRSVSGHAASAISVVIFCIMMILTNVAGYLGSKETKQAKTKAKKEQEIPNFVKLTEEKQWRT